MLNKFSSKIVASYVAVFCLVPLLFQGAAQAAGELDDVLSGFDEIEEPVQPVDTNTDAELDGILSGFDDPQNNKSDETGDGAEKTKTLQWIDPFGSFTLSGSWNFAHDAPDAGEADYRGLSMLRTTGALGLDFDMGKWQARVSGHGFYDAAYSIQGRDQYTASLLDEYEQELEFDEVYLEGSLADNLDLKVGRQVVVWGKADNLRVTDILNPLDNRTPGMVDIKYKRLPVTMSKLDYYTGPWNLSGIVINEIRFDSNTVYNSDFYPGDTAAVSETKPTNFALDTQQFALAANGIFSGWDLSFYQAWVYDSRAHLSYARSTPERVHNRVSMSGLAGNIAFGNWLFKGESAWWYGLEYAVAPDEEFNRIEVMAGVEYTGFSETTLSIEFVNRHIVDFDQDLEASPDYAQEDLQQTALMLSRDFLNDIMQFKFIASIFGIQGEDGAYERFQLEYDLSDHSTLTGGMIFYQSGDLYAFSEIEDNDRIFLEYSYAF